MNTIIKFFARKRTYGIYLFSSVILGYLFFTDPDRGGSTRDMLEGVAAVGLAFTCAHILRKFLFDYIHLESHVEDAKKGSIAASLVVLAVMIFYCVAALIFSTRAHAVDVRTYIPVGAKTYCPILQDERLKLWANHPDPAALCSLVEQESCISLTHSKCWNPASRLKTDREEGAGFGQITRAYNTNGTIRFDALDSAKALEPSLNEWSWFNVYTRPDLQLRAIVAMNRDCFNKLSRLVTDKAQALRMCDAAYNGGYAGMQQERRACGQKIGCDAQKWTANVELLCLKSKTKWKGYGASACEINRDHVVKVFDIRREKYLVFIL